MTLSEHAKQRYETRYLEKADFDLDNIKERGFSKEDFSRKSSLRKYLNNVEKKKANSECFVYLNKVFVIVGDTVVTTFPLKRRFTEIFMWYNWRYNNVSF